MTAVAGSGNMRTRRHQPGMPTLSSNAAKSASLVPQFQFGFGGKFGAAAKGAGADTNSGDEDLDEEALADLMERRVAWALDEAHLGTDGLERGKTFRDRRRKSARWPLRRFKKVATAIPPKVRLP